MDRTQEDLCTGQHLVDIIVQFLSDLNPFLFLCNYNGIRDLLLVIDALQFDFLLEQYPVGDILLYTD